MARFRGTVQGSRGSASRLGHGTIRTNTNGWELCVDVDGYKIDDQDEFEVLITGGSNNRLRRRPVFSVRLVDGALVAVFSSEFGGQVITLED
mgnify:CR=1 FL=1